MEWSIIACATLLLLLVGSILIRFKEYVTLKSALKRKEKLIGIKNRVKAEGEIIADVAREILSSESWYIGAEMGETPIIREMIKVKQALVCVIKRLILLEKRLMAIKKVVIGKFGRDMEP